MYCVTISLTPSVTHRLMHGSPTYSIPHHPFWFSEAHIRTLKCDFILVNNMTRATFLLDLPSCPLVVVCCFLSCVNLQPVSFKRTRTQSRLCISLWQDRSEDSVRHHYYPVPHEPYQQICAPVWLQQLVCMCVLCERYVAVKNHNTAPSSLTALFVVRGRCVLPRLLVGEGRSVEV